ncbi:MAG: orotidine-5'-phosphate decarboxylase [Ruminococcaceae bacterium]|nr:orotidine-5'-phosphate decarboxylase [Oscillospiraceae bacterium]
MVIDQLVKQILSKKNPCIMGIDPEWSKIPECYKHTAQSPPEAILAWAMDVIDTVADIVPAVKPQMAFFEVYGAEGVGVHQKVVQYAHSKGLVVVDDSKRNDIGNTAKAYAFAHLAKDGPINADFLTVSPFLGTDSIQPFVDTAVADGKGIFVLVKTSNPSSGEISEAVNDCGERVRDWLAGYVNSVGNSCTGKYGYSGIGAVVGATYQEEARQLRKIMKNNFFLVPGFGVQGGGAKDVVSCFNDDGLGAIVSSSRGILYHHLNVSDYDHSRAMYMHIVRAQTESMRDAVYCELRRAYRNMAY